MPPNSPPSSGLPLRQSERRSREAGRFSGARASHLAESTSTSGLTGHGRVAAAGFRFLKSPFLHILKALQMKSDQESRLKVDIFQLL